MILRIRWRKFSFSSSATSHFRFCTTSKENAEIPHRAVRVRFAPSPTGFLHLGGLRTILFNYLFARSRNGRFILRIEDTDRKRLVTGAVENLLDILSWLNLPVDEGPSKGGAFGPYLQSQRLNLYKQEAEELIRRDAAYKCFCSEDRLMLLRNEALKNRQPIKYDGKCRHLSREDAEQRAKSGEPHVVRFKLDPTSRMKFTDVVYKDLDHGLEHEGDFVLMKSDGFPTYHFANVVDDRHMEITHVLRGEEWLTSTAKHLALYQAFNWKPPTFAHLPLMLTTKKGPKLSKRESSSFVEYYKNLGYYPLALINSVSSTGGGFNEREKNRLYDLDELTRMFDLDTVLRHGTSFELTYLNFYNSECLRRNDTKTLVSDSKLALKRKYGDVCTFDDAYVAKVVEYARNRMSTVNDLMEKDLECFWKVPDGNYTMVREMLKKDSGMTYLDMLEKVLQMVEAEEDAKFERTSLSDKLKLLAEGNEWNYPMLFKVLRAAINEWTFGPPIPELFEVMGRKLIVDRLHSALDAIRNKRDENAVNLS